MNAAQVHQFTAFLVEWLRALIPGMKAVKVEGRRVSVKDAIGWRRVGTLDDYLPIARALGRI